MIKREDPYLTSRKKSLQLIELSHPSLMLMSHIGSRIDNSELLKEQ